MPKELQVSASISSQYENSAAQSRTSIQLLIPGKTFDIIPVEVIFDPYESVGLYVTADGKKDTALAEMARRGGFFSICQSVWEQSNIASIQYAPEIFVPGLEFLYPPTI